MTSDFNLGQVIYRSIVEKGLLVDLYSEEFFAKQPTIEEDSSAPFSRCGLKLIKEYQDDPEETKKPQGHLVFIYTEQFKNDLPKSVVDLYPGINSIVSADDMHEPDFLIVNQHTKQILCAGLGRKNRLFIHDAYTGYLVNIFGLGCGKIDSDYVDKFTQHDCYDAIEYLLGAINNLGQVFFDRDHLPGNIEYVEMALDRGPDDDGLYYIKDYDDDKVDDEGYQREQLEDIKDEFIYADEREKEAAKMINIFFPDLDISELNTGDY